MQTVVDDLDESTLRNVISLVHSATGISIPEHKKTMIQRRLSSRLKLHSITNYSEYIALVKKDKSELKHFINMVTTNETNFFRTDRVWKYFEEIFLHNYQKDHKGKTLNIWSAAASTGEEGYSLGMVCEEFKRTLTDSFNYKVLGTDISSQVIEHAKIGKYEGRNIDNLRIKNSQRLSKHFTERNNQFCISSVLKSNVTFKVHNLFEILEETHDFDIIFLRNVLIYFSAEDQEKVIKNIESKLSINGILVIGESESLSSLDTNLEFVSPLIYRRVS